MWGSNNSVESGIDNKLRNFGFFLKTDHLVPESISKIPSFPSMNIWKEISNQFSRLLFGIINPFFKMEKPFLKIFIYLFGSARS